MDIGVLMYCFDTDEVAYHGLAERCVSQVKTHLGLHVTIVTNRQTMARFKQMDGVEFRVVEHRPGNFRPYRGKVLAWHNRERVLAYEHSPYETTILMDCDYFVFSDRLLELSKTEFDVLLHDRVHDITGKNLIAGRNEGVIPLVWATVVLFRKTPNAETVFAMIRHVAENYNHYRHLYRIKYNNYRNDYAFAIALHQLGLGDFIPSPMPMSAVDVDVLDSDSEGVCFRHRGSIYHTNGQDVHIMDKEWCNG